MVDYVAGNDATDDDLRASVSGSMVTCGDGNDVLRGGKTADILIGGAGEDKLWGGAGGDQFRFFGDQIGSLTDPTDVDAIYDLNFADGDLLVFGKYNGLFGTDAAGLNGFAAGDSAIISSFAGLAAACEASGGRITFTGSAGADLLMISFDNGAGCTQTLRISQGYNAFVSELSPV